MTSWKPHLYCQRTSNKICLTEIDSSATKLQKQLSILILPHADDGAAMYADEAAHDSWRNLRGRPIIVVKKKTPYKPVSSEQI